MYHTRPTKDAAALLEDVNDLQKVVHSILDVAFNIGSREFGCERCSMCTIQISKVLTDWLTKKPANCEEIFKKLEQFLCFPHAMSGILEKCIDCADQKKTRIDSFATQLNLICDGVIKRCTINIDKVATKDTLNLSRLSAIIEVFKEKLKEVLSKHHRWETVSPSIENLESKAQQLEEFFQSNTLLFNEYKNGQNFNVKRPKRICGGGALSLCVGEYKQENQRNIHVVDFSPTHLLGLVSEPILDEKKTEYNGIFQPCQRELPFEVNVSPATREYKGRTDKYIPIDSKPLNYFIERGCKAQYYQVFEIKEISPLYYYLSLCACLTPSSKLYQNSIIFLDRHNITDNLPIKEYRYSLSKLKSVVKI